MFRIAQVVSVLILLFVLIAPSAGTSVVPDPEQCSVVPADDSLLVIAPKFPAPIGASMQTVTIRDANGDPIPYALVQFLFAPGLVSCVTSNEGTTGPNGVVVIPLAGGGCLRDFPGAVRVAANGVPIRSYGHAKSPDFNGVEGDLRVNLQDLLDFTANLASPGCHDYDGNGTMNLSDTLIFSPAFAPQHTCP